MLILFSHKTVEPLGIAGFEGNGFIVIVRESEEILFPQLLTTLTEIFAIPLYVSDQSTLAELVFPEITPAFAG